MAICLHVYHQRYCLYMISTWRVLTMVISPHQSRFLLEAWMACSGHVVQEMHPERLQSIPIEIGLDLGSINDLLWFLTMVFFDMLTGSSRHGAPSPKSIATWTSVIASARATMASPRNGWATRRKTTLVTLNSWSAERERERVRNRLLIVFFPFKVFTWHLVHEVFSSHLNLAAATTRPPDCSRFNTSLSSASQLNMPPGQQRVFHAICEAHWIPKLRTFQVWYGIKCILPNKFNRFIIIQIMKWQLILERMHI